MSIESIGKSVGTVIDERLSSPLVSGFVISWTVINWKFIVVLLSDTSVSQTFDMASELYKTRNDWWGWNIALPFAIALAYVYLLPLLSRPVHRQWRENQKQMEDDRKAVADLELLDLDTSRSMRSEIYLLRQRMADLIVERDSALDARKTALELKTLAEHRMGSAEAEAEAHKQRVNEAKVAMDVSEEKLQRTTEEMVYFQCAVDQVLRLAAGIDKTFLPVDLAYLGNEPLHVLILSYLKAKKVVEDRFELRMLYVLWAFRESRPDGMLQESILKRVGDTLEGVPVPLVIGHLKDTGYLKAGNQHLPVYKVTASGEAIISALGEFDPLFNIRTEDGAMRLDQYGTDFDQFMRRFGMRK